MKKANLTEHNSSIIQLFQRLGDPVGKSLEYILSVIGESNKSYPGDPLLCLANSVSRVWFVENLAVTMYFDSEGTCFGADLNNIILPFGISVQTESDIMNLLKNFR